MNTARNLEQIENEIDKEEKLMSIHKTNGNYADAEVSRLKIEQLCKDHEARALYEMQLRHKQQQKHLLDSNHQEYVAFNSFWNKREAEIKQQEEKSESEMMVRHKSEQSQTRKELQVLNSPKVKESSQLLNLRKMQEHMVKQKNFAEAHKVQAQIFQMQKVQKQAWLSKRDEKIETALNTLKGKQNVQFTNLKKRFKTLLDESMTERKLQEERLLLKHNNLLKDLKSQQQKELLNQKGEFKSKGGKESPMRTKSSIHA